MTIAEQIYTIVKNLPPDQASEVLDFAEFICTKQSIANSKPDLADASLLWTELVDSLTGAWADGFPSLESIRAEEGQKDTLQSVDCI
jgi:hypothetical protein